MAAYDTFTPGTSGGSGPPPNQDILNGLLRTARDAAIGYGGRLVGNVASDALGLGAGLGVGQRGSFNPAAPLLPLAERAVQVAKLAGPIGQMLRSGASLV